MKSTCRCRGRSARPGGRARAERAWLRSVRAVGDLVNLARRLQIECDMQRNRALYLAGDDMGARGLRTEAEARHAAGIACDHLRPAELRDRFGIDRTAALVSDASASANPAQLAAGVAGRGCRAQRGLTTSWCGRRRTPISISARPRRDA